MNNEYDSGEISNVPSKALELALAYKTWTQTINIVKLLFRRIYIPAVILTYIAVFITERRTATLVMMILSPLTGYFLYWVMMLFAYLILNTLTHLFAFCAGKCYIHTIFTISWILFPITYAITSVFGIYTGWTR